MKRILVACEKANVKIALENVVPIPHGSDFYLLGDCIEDLLACGNGQTGIIFSS